MYTVKYQEEEFQVTLKNKIKIEKIKAFLLLKRIIRKGRILIPDNLKMYVLKRKMNQITKLKLNRRKKLK